MTKDFEKPMLTAKGFGPLSYSGRDSIGTSYRGFHNPKFDDAQKDLGHRCGEYHDAWKALIAELNINPFTATGTFCTQN